jgi:hypothetical protein
MHSKPAQRDLRGLFIDGTLTGVLAGQSVAVREVTDHVTLLG